MSEENKTSLAKSFTGLPMDGLIGGPLIAAAKANSLMAIEQVKFLLKYCFSKEDNEEGYHPVMINMSLTRSYLSGSNSEGEPNLEKVTTTFSLPLLTMIPINHLGVNSVEIDFDMEVKAQHQIDSASNSSLIGQRALKGKRKSKPKGFDPSSQKHGYNEVQLVGTVSYDTKEKQTKDSNDHYEKSNSARLSVSVKAGPLPLPVGVNAIIDVFSKSIHPVEVPKTESTDKTDDES